MKYIKTYEECTDKEKLIYDDCNDSWYWKVSNKYPDVLIAFDKIGAPENFGDGWLWSKDNTKVKDFYIHMTIYRNSEVNWAYSDLGFVNPDYRKPPKYMGKVKVTNEDRKNWEMKQNAKKFNV